MKKCRECGAIQNDSRKKCVDCGALLGSPMSKEEQEAVEAALDDKLDGMAERAEDFYVPLRDKIMGVICIIGIIAAILLLNFCQDEIKQIKSNVPDGVIVSQGSGSITIISGDNASDYQYPTPRSRTLEEAQLCSLISLVALIIACPMLFFPRFMWLLDTLKYRLFYHWDTTPSDFALILRKTVTYVLFVVGVGSVLYGYWLYL